MTSNGKPLPKKLIAIFLPWLLFILAVAPSLPAFKFLLESSMVFHMTVQIPALIGAGYWLGRQLFGNIGQIPKDVELSATLSCWLWILLTSMFWMLPISLDKALISHYWDFFKVISLLLSGLLLRPALAGPKILTLFFVGSTVMMLFFIGYFYQDSELRLCNSYLIESQHTAGLGLILLAIILLSLAIFTLCQEIFNSDSE